MTSICKGCIQLYHIRFEHHLYSYKFKMGTTCLVRITLFKIITFFSDKRFDIKMNNEIYSNDLKKHHFLSLPVNRIIRKTLDF